MVDNEALDIKQLIDMGSFTDPETGRQPKLPELLMIESF